MNKIIVNALIISILGFQTVGAMIGGADLNQQLLQGAAQNNFAQVQAALEQGANVNATSNLNFTPLHFVVLNGNNAIAEYLIERGANVNAPAAGGNTPLHNAAVSLYPDMVRLLLDNGADVTLQNGNFQTPLRVLQVSLQQPQQLQQQLEIDSATMYRNAQQIYKYIQEYYQKAAHKISEEEIGSLPIAFE